MAKGQDRRRAGNLVPMTRQAARPPEPPAHPTERLGFTCHGPGVQARSTFLGAVGTGHRQEAVQGFVVPTADGHELVRGFVLEESCRSAV